MTIPNKEGWINQIVLENSKLTTYNETEIIKKIRIM